MGNAWPLGEMWGDRLNQHMDVINSFIEPVIQSALDRKKKGEVEKGRMNILHVFKRDSDVGRKLIEKLFLMQVITRIFW